MIHCRSGLLFFLLMIGQLSAQTVSDEEIIRSGKLPRFDPLSPVQAIESFDVVDGYRVELVAAEPLVTDPIAFCFDPAGRLIVVEMRGYSERADSNTGRVRRLSDHDGDGRMDDAETLLDGLSWPTAVACWGEGIVIGVAPDILYLPMDENGKPGDPEVMFTGFGRSNVQGLFNSFRWGGDLRLHGATSSSGAEVTGPTLEGKLRLGRRDFAIRFPDRTFSAVVGGAQHGLSFNRWGDKFVCSNSDHLQQVLAPPEVAGRASRYTAEPSFRRSIATDGKQAEVFRRSPVEPWRILRTHLRVSGQARGPIEGGGRAAGYFTGATGVHLYEGDQWQLGDQEIALVCDVGSNLVHRKRLVRDGLWYSGRRIDEDTEFLRSTDTWFRPVQLGGGPDGALYIADMYREVIEHPKSLPPSIKSQVDLNSGNDRGRMWRVVATKHRVADGVSQPLDELSDDELIELLKHKNGWHRRTASRLLLERLPVNLRSLHRIRRIATSAPLPESRTEALALLGRISGGLNRATFLVCLKDPHPQVQRRALEMATREPKFTEGVAINDIQDVLRDGDESVLFELARGLIALMPDETEDRYDTLHEINRSAGDSPWVAWAAEGSLGGSLPSSFDGKDLEQAWMKKVLFQAVNAGDAATALRLADLLQSIADDQEQASGEFALVAEAITAAPLRDELTPVSDWVAETGFARAVEQVEAGSADPALMKLVRWATADKALELMQRLLKPSRSPQAQRVALDSLAGNDRKSNQLLIDRLPELTPGIQAETWNTLASRQTGLRCIAEALHAGKIARDDIPQKVIETMRRSPDRKLSKIVGEQDEQKPVDLAKYEASLGESGSVQAGEAKFKRLCAACHSPEAGALPVGPPLKSVVDKSPEQIVLSILDPNREVDPKYYRIQMLTVDGSLVSGVLVEETSASLTVVDEKGKPTRVARADVDTLRTLKQSLMPTNLAEQITPQEMSDLIAYLKQTR